MNEATCALHEAFNSACSYCRIAQLLSEAPICEGCERPVTERMEHYDWMSNNGRFRCQPVLVDPAPAAGEDSKALFRILHQTYAECLTPIAEAFGWNGGELDDSFVEWMKAEAAALREFRAAAPVAAAEVVPLVNADDLTERDRQTVADVDAELLSRAAAESEAAAVVAEDDRSWSCGGVGCCEEVAR